MTSNIKAYFESNANGDYVENERVKQRIYYGIKNKFQSFSPTNQYLMLKKAAEYGNTEEAIKCNLKARGMALADLSFLLISSPFIIPVHGNYTVQSIIAALLLAPVSKKWSKRFLYHGASYSSSFLLKPARALSDCATIVAPTLNKKTRFDLLQKIPHMLWEKGSSQKSQSIWNHGYYYDIEDGRYYYDEDNDRQSRILENMMKI